MTDYLLHIILLIILSALAGFSGGLAYGISQHKKFSK